MCTVNIQECERIDNFYNSFERFQNAPLIKEEIRKFHKFYTEIRQFKSPDFIPLHRDVCLIEKKMELKINYEN